MVKQTACYNIPMPELSAITIKSSCWACVPKRKGTQNCEKEPFHLTISPNPRTSLRPQQCCCDIMGWRWMRGEDLASCWRNFINLKSQYVCSKNQIHNICISWCEQTYGEACVQKNRQSAAEGVWVRACICARVAACLCVPCLCIHLRVHVCAYLYVCVHTPYGR